MAKRPILSASTYYSMKLTIQTPQPLEAPCPHFNLCGGCSFQQVSYKEQLQQKESFVSHLFNRAVEPIICSPSQWRYRNKMEFSFSQDRAGKKFLGLLMKRGRVLNLESCHLADMWMQETLMRVFKWWEGSSITAYHPPSNQGSLRTLTLRQSFYTREKMVILTLSGHSDFQLTAKDLESFREVVGEVDSLLIRKQIIAKKCPTYFEEYLLAGKNFIQEKLHDKEGRGYLFKIRGASFFQPNTQSAEKLYQKVIELADLKPSHIVYDLYCGTGTLGIFAASHVKTVFGIEVVPEAIQDALENKRLNGVENLEVFLGEVEKTIKEIPDHPDVVLVDPPRVGLSREALSHLLVLKPSKIVYVSCNPVTQAANCEEFKKNGYQVQILQPVDQFPHTPHVENVAVLTVD